MKLHVHVYLWILNNLWLWKMYGDFTVTSKISENCHQMGFSGSPMMDFGPGGLNFHVQVYLWILHKLWGGNVAANIMKHKKFKKTVMKRCFRALLRCILHLCPWFFAYRCILESLTISAIGKFAEIWLKHQTFRNCKKKWFSSFPDMNLAPAAPKLQIQVYLWVREFLQVATLWTSQWNIKIA